MHPRLKFVYGTFHRNKFTKQKNKHSCHLEKYRFLIQRLSTKKIKNAEHHKLSMFPETKRWASMFQWFPYQSPSFRQIIETSNIDAKFPLVSIFARQSRIRFQLRAQQTNERFQYSEHCFFRFILLEQMSKCYHQLAKSQPIVFPNRENEYTHQTFPFKRYLGFSLLIYDWSFTKNDQIVETKRSLSDSSGIRLHPHRTSNYLVLKFSVYSSSNDISCTELLQNCYTENRQTNVSYLKIQNIDRRISVFLETRLLNQSKLLFSLNRVRSKIGHQLILDSGMGLAITDSEMNGFL